MSIIFDCQLLIGLGPLLSLLPSAAVAVLEDRDGENCQRDQQAEPGSDHADPMADPPGDVFAALAPELGSTRAMGQKLREEDHHEGRDRPSVEIV
jgi:hypothetical protein